MRLVYASKHSNSPEKGIAYLFQRVTQSPLGDRPNPRHNLLSNNDLDSRWAGLLWTLACTLTTTKEPRFQRIEGRASLPLLIRVPKIRHLTSRMTWSTAGQ
jgi:hypothetical protein